LVSIVPIVFLDELPCNDPQIADGSGRKMILAPYNPEWPAEFAAHSHSIERSYCRYPARSLCLASMRVAAEASLADE